MQTHIHFFLGPALRLRPALNRLVRLIKEPSNRHTLIEHSKTQIRLISVNGAG